MSVVLVGWMIFYFDDFQTLITAFSVAFGHAGNACTDPVSETLVINNVPFILIAAIASTPVLNVIRRLVEKSSPLTESILRIVYNIVMLILCVASLVGSTYNPFLYFRF